MVIVQTSKVAPGIKRKTLIALRRALVEYDRDDTAEGWGILAGVSAPCARKYLDYMVDHDEALRTTLEQSATRRITWYRAVS